MLKCICSWQLPPVAVVQFLHGFSSRCALAVALLLACVCFACVVLRVVNVGGKSQSINNQLLPLAKQCECIDLINSVV
jgi:hypothetical protein